MQLLRSKKDETSEFEAQMVLATGERLPLKVRPRGKSRRERCSFIPLELNFKRKALAGTVFDGQNKLKLVTHCGRSMASSGYLASELLVYRLLNYLTDYSFRVRALESFRRCRPRGG